MYNANHVRAVTAYQKVGVETLVSSADDHRLIQLVFTSFLQSLSTVRVHMLQGNLSGKCQQMSRAVHLLQDGLDAALDIEQGGEIAVRLRDLYDYCSVRLALANVRNDPSILDEVWGLIEPIARSWDQIRPAEDVSVLK